MIKFIAGLLLLSLTTQSLSNEFDGKNLSGTQVPNVVIQVRWVSSYEELLSLMRSINPNCTIRTCKAFSELVNHPSGHPLCLITAMKPDNWDDKSAVRIMGHELLHCLGYSH